MKLICLLFAFIYSSDFVWADEETVREDKQFLPTSLFTVVQYQNLACLTNQATTGVSKHRKRHGICLSGSLCQERGGTPRGNCASGFGVCCLFTVSESGSTVNQNMSYIQNPRFPNTYSASNSVSYTVRKASSDVCFLRLDFESFTLLGTGGTTDVDTNENLRECQDTFEVTVNSGLKIPIICGENAGQHMYIDLGAGASDLASLDFTFSDRSSLRRWDIKVTQYDCNSEYAPPNGCLQYHTGLTGRIKTFNFDLPNDNHLPDQEYSICIRQEPGYCCMQYLLCQDEEDSFSLGGFEDVLLMDASCDREDFVTIAASSVNCQLIPNQQLTSKYCGNSDTSIPICDCTPPFTVDIVTNGNADEQPNMGPIDAIAQIVPNFKFLRSSDTKLDTFDSLNDSIGVNPSPQEEETLNNVPRDSSFERFISHPAAPSRGLCVDYSQVPCPS